VIHRFASRSSVAAGSIHPAGSPRSADVELSTTRAKADIDGRFVRESSVQSARTVNDSAQCARPLVQLSSSPFRRATETEHGFLVAARGRLCDSRAKRGFIDANRRRRVFLHSRAARSMSPNRRPTVGSFTRAVGRRKARVPVVTGSRHPVGRTSSAREQAWAMNLGSSRPRALAASSNAMSPDVRLRVSSADSRAL